MAEVYVITWSKSNLELRRIPSEGQWRVDNILPMKSVPAQRPTRMSRINHPDSGGQMAIALHDLIDDVEMTIPCWLIIPRHWVQIFNIPESNLTDPEQQIEHFKWESTIRLAGRPDDYSFLPILKSVYGKYSCVIILRKILDFYINSAAKAELDVTGISVEPESGGKYSFEKPIDMRDCRTFEKDSDEQPITKKRFSIPPAAAAIIMLAFLASAYYLFWMPALTSKNKPVVTKQTSEKIAQKATPITTDSINQIIPADKQPKQTATSSSTFPVQLIFDALPKFTKVNLITISSAELIVEINGEGIDDNWLTRLKNNPIFAKAQLAGNYKTGNETVSIVRLPNPGRSSETASYNTAKWEQVTKDAGLTPHGRSVVGSFDSAMRLVNTLWQAPSGINKVYLAPSRDRWVITVQ